MKVQWPNGLGNKHKDLLFSNMSSWFHKGFMKNFVSKEIYVFLTFYQIFKIQLKKKEINIWKLLKLLVWTSKENPSNSSGSKVETNSNSNKKLEFQELVILHQLLFQRAKKYIQDLEDHSVNKILRISWMIFWRTRQNYQNFMNYLCWRESSHLRLRKDATNIYALVLQVIIKINNYEIDFLLIRNILSLSNFCLKI